MVTWYQDISSRSRPASRDRGREPGWARFRVLEAEDGLQALSQLAGEKPDVMLLDLGLPRLNGVQVLRFIRQQPRLADLPVVVVSDQLDLLNAADDIAADLVCPKPCEPQELMRVVRAVLDRDKAH